MSKKLNGQFPESLVIQLHMAKVYLIWVISKIRFNLSYMILVRNC